MNSPSTGSKKPEAPRWLVLRAEIDHLYFILGQMLEDEKKLDGISRMIDKATGYEETKLKDATEIMDEIKKLKAEYDRL